MKKLVMLLLVATLLISGCQGEKIKSEKANENVTEANCLLERRMVIKDGDVIGGREAWDDFFQETTMAKKQGDTSLNCVINIDQYWTAENGEELYYQTVLSYKDGNFIYENITEDRVYNFKYLIERSDQYKNAAIKERIYYLVDDETVTYDELQRSLFSSQSTDGIPHYMIFWEEIE